MLQTTNYNSRQLEHNLNYVPELLTPCTAFCRRQHAGKVARVDVHILYSPGYSKANRVCIRVDGAIDEGPYHEEVQYWWAERHLLQVIVVTPVITRSSGSRLREVLGSQSTPFSVWLPFQYLRCCYHSDCLHPIQFVKVEKLLQLYPGCPIIDFLPLPQAWPPEKGFIPFVKCPCCSTVHDYKDGVDSSVT